MNFLFYCLEQESRTVGYTPKTHIERQATQHGWLPAPSCWAMGTKE